MGFFLVLHFRLNLAYCTEFFVKLIIFVISIKWKKSSGIGIGFCLKQVLQYRYNKVQYMV